MAPDTHKASGSGIGSTILGLAQATLAKVPGAPDGLKPQEAMSITDLAQGPPNQNKRVALVKDIIGLVASGRVIGDALVGVQAAASVGKPIDDRDMLMEHLIQRLCKMESDSPIRSGLSDGFIQLLWKDLPHPVATLLGDKYRFRQADGSHNNLFEPSLGAAGQHYARTVPALHPLPPNLPEPELIFDALLKRDKFVEQPSGINSMMFAFAVIIVHSIFRTKYDDPSINEASSYLDLSPVYGHNLAQQMKIRSKVQGLLYPDVVAEDRLFLMPPQITALLVLFSRNHNYIAEMLFKINERGLFRPWEELNDKEKAWQDEEIFQTARLINGAHFIGIVLHDYVISILGINRSDTDWFLDPTKDMKSMIAGSGRVERGTGNIASVEFNLLYRWHSTLSRADTKWMEDLMIAKTGKQVDDITTEDFVRAALKASHDLGDDPRKWNIPGLRRGRDGRFSDDDLARVLTNAISEPAGAFRANGIPSVMRAIDCLGMKAARSTWNVCTLNDFRRYFGLREHESFLEWNSDPDVANIAEKLFVHPSNIPLYEGLLAEEPKPGNMIGSGLAVNHTISRAILSDAVSLVRGDRFYTHDYTVASLTAWGMEYVASNPKDGSKGGLMGKLILRNLPNNFEYNSTYALFPFQTPKSMKSILESQGLADKYTFSPPIKTAPWKTVTNPNACDAVLRDSPAFGVIYTAAVEDLSRDKYGFFIGFDSARQHGPDRKMMDEVVWPPGYDKEHRAFYEDTVRKLLRDSSWRLPGSNTHCVDYARDVGDMASVYWMATYFGIPLKTKDTPHGIITPQELYAATAAMFCYTFMNWDPVASFKLKESALSAAKLIGRIIETRIKETQMSMGLFGGIFHGPQSLVSPGPEATALYKRLLKYNRSMDAMVSNCLGIITASSQNQAQAATQILDVYLQPEHADSKAKMMTIANIVSNDTDRQFLGYTWEAQRLNPQVPFIPRVARKNVTVQNGDQNLTINVGDRIAVAIKIANMDSSKWGPHPEKIDPNRDPHLYRVFGSGMHSCLGHKVVNMAQPVLLREMMKLGNLRRAPGKAGTDARVPLTLAGTPIENYMTPTNQLFPFPSSMLVQYDA